VGGARAQQGGGGSKRSARVREIKTGRVVGHLGSHHIHGDGFTTPRLYIVIRLTRGVKMQLNQ
jgi:hypothetical protein